VGDGFFSLKFALKVTHQPFEKRQVSAHNVSNARDSEKKFSYDAYEVNHGLSNDLSLPLSSPKGGSKNNFLFKKNKIQV